VGVTGLASDNAVLRAVVEADGGRFDRVDRVTIGFSAVPSLIAGRVDAVVSFWNVEGVALRERGVRTREFRVDDYGAPRYPELVLVTSREAWEDDRKRYETLLEALAEGTRAALADRSATVADLVEASGADEALVRAQLDAVAPALRPPGSESSTGSPMCGGRFLSLRARGALPRAPGPRAPCGSAARLG
jgi:putative hydroxymethylpyrimidine transport system substrate-binding protein